MRSLACLEGNLRCLSLRIGKEALVLCQGSCANASDSARAELDGKREGSWAVFEAQIQSVLRSPSERMHSLTQWHSKWAVGCWAVPGARLEGGAM